MNLGLPGEKSLDWWDAVKGDKLGLATAYRTGAHCHRRLSLDDCLRQRRSAGRLGAVGSGPVRRDGNGRTFR